MLSNYSEKILCEFLIKTVVILFLLVTFALLYSAYRDEKTRLYIVFTIGLPLVYVLFSKIGVIFISCLITIVIIYIGLNPERMLFYADTVFYLNILCPFSLAILAVLLLYMNFIGITTVMSLILCFTALIICGVVNYYYLCLFTGRRFFGFKAGEFFFSL